MGMVASRGAYGDENQVVLARLKEAYKKSKQRNLPADCLANNLRFSLSDDSCEIFIGSEYVHHNMQSDTASFDGWALVLNTWLDCAVSLAWDSPKKDDDVNKDKLIQRHYQRFLYRVIRFLNANSTWFSVIDECENHLHLSKVLTPDGKSRENPGYYLMNPPTSRERVDCEYMPLTEMDEDYLENWFHCNPTVLFDALKWPEDKAILTRQVPVGLYSGIPSDKYTVFPGGKAAVDLGATYSREVALFELKDATNIKVGSLSELLFYCHIIRDLQLKAFKYHIKKNEGNSLDFSGAESVRGLILAERLQPLLEHERLFSTLNKAFSSRNESFGFIQYYPTFRR